MKHASKSIVSASRSHNSQHFDVWLLHRGLRLRIDRPPVSGARFAKMSHALSDVEKAILRVKAAEQRIADQRNRIAQLRESGCCTEMSEKMLRSLVTSLELMKAHLGRLTAPTTAYRCYFMMGEIVRGVQAFECADDAEAIVRSWELLEDRPEFHHVEIWEKKRLVARLPRRVFAAMASKRDERHQ